MPDIDETSEFGKAGEARYLRRHGSEPTFWLGTLDGRWLHSQGKRFLATAKTSALDPLDALFHARHTQTYGDVWFVTDGPKEETRPAETTPVPAAAAREKRVVQQSLFD